MLKTPMRPGSGWDVAGVTNATKDHVLVRKASVQVGNVDWSPLLEQRG